MKKTKEQKKALRNYGMFLPLWQIVDDYGASLLARNRITGEFRVVKK